MFHELGRCYLELGGNEEARNFGVRSLTAADEISDEKWKIMAIVLISQAECKCLLLWSPVARHVLYDLASFYLIILSKYVQVCSPLTFKSQHSFFFSAKMGNFESSVSCFERALNLAKLQDDDDPTMLNDIQKVQHLSEFTCLHFSKGFCSRCLHC